MKNYHFNFQFSFLRLIIIIHKKNWIFNLKKNISDINTCNWRIILCTPKKMMNFQKSVTLVKIVVMRFSKIQFKARTFYFKMLLEISANIDTSAKLVNEWK